MKSLRSIISTWTLTMMRQCRTWRSRHTRSTWRMKKTWIGTSSIQKISTRKQNRKWRRRTGTWWTSGINIWQILFPKTCLCSSFNLNKPKRRSKQSKRARWSTLEELILSKTTFKLTSTSWTLLQRSFSQEGTNTKESSASTLQL